MPDLTNRSPQKEILDGDNIPFAHIQQNMRELNTINTWLGGHNVTIAGLKNLVGKQSTLHICEIGCGGGDNLHAIYNYCKKQNINATFTGIDLNPGCIAFAKKQYPNMPCTWLISDYKKVMFSATPDMIFSSLFCHHFTNEEIIFMLQWLKENSNTGFFINDLHRHKLAWYSIRFITSLFSKSYMVKHDAPLSVARGFTKTEWLQLFKHAGFIKGFSIKWQWAFRYLVMYKHD